MRPYLALLLLPLAVSADQLIGAGSNLWHMRLAADTTTRCVLSATGGQCAQFGSGTANPYHLPSTLTSGSVQCCWSMASGLDIGATGELTDGSGPNGSGPCAGFALNTSQARRDQRPIHTDILGTPGVIAGAAGARLGLCSTSVTTRIGTYYAPCGISTAAIASGAADTDCTNFGGGTCVLYSSASATARAFSSVFLLCEAETTANVDAMVEAVQR